MNIKEIFDAAFTPGPWHAQEEQLRPSSEITGWTIVTPAYDVVSGHLAIRRQADAALIASAPDMYNRIRVLEDELNAYKLKELAAQGEPSTWYDDALRRRVKACEEKLEVRDQLVLELRGRIADLDSLATALEKHIQKLLMERLAIRRGEK